MLQVVFHPAGGHICGGGQLGNGHRGLLSGDGLVLGIAAQTTAHPVAAQQQPQAPGGDAHGKEHFLQKPGPMAVLQEKQVVTDLAKQDNTADNGQNNSDVPQYIGIAIGNLGRAAEDTAPLLFCLSGGAALFLCTPGGGFCGVLRLGCDDRGLRTPSRLALAV